MVSEDAHGFGFLQQCWPDLAELGRKAEQVSGQEPDFVAIRLRGLTEQMAVKLVRHLDLPSSPNDAHFDRLVRLESADLLDARLLSKFHTIRKLGNKAAHNGGVTEAQAEALLEDAWSLCCWFCRFMRPEVEWLIPPRRGAVPTDRAPGPSTPDLPAERRPTAPGGQSNVLRFPDERVRRIREQVTRALAAVDPRIRDLRTRITLRDAFTETLSDDQSACLASLEAFLSDPEQRVFLLKGYAGTGKTFLAKGITEFLAAQGRAFRLAAPTGRAAKIISQKTGRPARTLHSQIYDFSDLREYAVGDGELGSETFKFHAGIASNQDQANTVYIVDEASLVSDAYSESEFFRSGSGYLLRDLIEYVGFTHGENDRKLIFVGDAAQLPPVGMATSPALDTEYLRQNFGLSAAEYELRAVLRQKADSGVIRNVMPLRESLLRHTFSSLEFVFNDDVRRLRSDEVLPLYMALRGAGGPTDAMVITHSNVEAAKLNRAIRKELFPDRDVVGPGDRLIVTANTILSGVFLANGEFVDVADAGDVVERRTVNLRHRNAETGAVESLEVPLVFRDITLTLPSGDGGESVLSAKIIDDHLHGDAAGLGAAQQRALYVDFLKRHPGLNNGSDRERIGRILRQDPYFNALRVRFGYAVTCHRAQGGEWGSVFVSCPAGQNPRTAEYFRWMYTAMTRSSSKLYLIDPPEIRLKVVGMGGQSGDAADPAGGGADRALRLEAFQMDVLARVRQAIDGSGIVIEDVAHHQYQEAFYFSQGAETARVNISYNGKFAITGVALPGAGFLREKLGELLMHMVGQSVGASGQVPLGEGRADPRLPSRPFLKAFHNRLLPVLEEKGITVLDLKEQAWSQRYTFGRGTEVVAVDIFYDGRDRLKKCMPVVGRRFSAPSGKLLPEVLEILTTQVTP
jgi:hypothetical protein